MATESFLDVARSLLEDGDAKAAFADDPDGYLAARGFEGLSADDLADATGFVTETLPPKVAAQVGHPDTWGDDPLGRLAQLDPVPAVELEPEDADDEDDDGPTWDAGAGPVDDGGGFTALDDSVPDPGFGVGYTDNDVDDLSAPELHEGDLPLGFDLAIDDAGTLTGHDAVDPGAHALDAHEIAGQELPDHNLGQPDEHHPHVGVHDASHHGHDGGDLLDDLDL